MPKAIVCECNHCHNTFVSYSGFIKEQFCSQDCNFLHYCIPGDPDKCWEWTGAFNEKNYGVFGNKERAHRYSFRYHTGPLKQGLVIRHLCNNSRCVNPNHLAQGTYKENTADLKATGWKTDFRGEKHVFAKLTDEIVRDMIASKEDYKVLADRHNISQARVRDILSGRGWNHITGLPAFKPTRVYKKRIKENINGT